MKKLSSSLIPYFTKTYITNKTLSRKHLDRKPTLQTTIFFLTNSLFCIAKSSKSAMKCCSVGVSSHHVNFRRCSRSTRRLTPCLLRSIPFNRNQNDSTPCVCRSGCSGVTKCTTVYHCIPTMNRSSRWFRGVYALLLLEEVW